MAKQLPIEERKKLSSRAPWLLERDPRQAGFDCDGYKLFDEACRLGFEDIVSKKRDRGTCRAE